MSLRKLPKIEASRPLDVMGFAPREDGVARWDNTIKAAADNDASISILDVIGEDFWGEGVTVRRISAALRSIGARDVTVNINSPGGDFFEGIAIYNALRAHPHKVTIKVLGLAASAASVIAMAGDDVEIGKAGFVMIHNAWAVAIGNRHDFRAAADTLEPFDAAMASVYAARSGADLDEVTRWMDEERWFSGDQAIEAGLADALLPADAVAADNAPDAREMKATRRAEAAFMAQGMSRDERRSLIGELKGGRAVAGPDRPAVAGDDWAAQARSLMEVIKR